MTRPMLWTVPLVALVACLLVASCSNAGVEPAEHASVDLQAQPLQAAEPATAAAAAAPAQAAPAVPVQTNPLAAIDAQSAETQREYYKARAAATREAVKTQREALQALKAQKSDPAAQGRSKDEQQGLDDQITELDERIKQRELRLTEFDQKAR